MLRNRRFGFTIHRDDILRSSRPARRLRDGVDDAHWLGIVEAMAFSSRITEPCETFTDGAGI
jgi:hypothetical protein